MGKGEKRKKRERERQRQIHEEEGGTRDSVLEIDKDEVSMI